QAVVHDVTGHGRERASRSLGAEAQVDAERARQDAVEPVKMQESEGGARREDRRRRRPPLPESRLHVSPEEHFLRGPRDRAAHDARAPAIRPWTPRSTSSGARSGSAAWSTAIASMDARTIATAARP